MKAIIPQEIIENKILLMRGGKLRLRCLVVKLSKTLIYGKI